MPINYRKEGQFVILLGQTFPFREAIKALGGRYESTQKQWLLPWSEAAWDSVQRLARSTGGMCLDSPSAPLAVPPRAKNSEQNPAPSISSLDTQIRQALDQGQNSKANLSIEPSESLRISELLVMIEQKIKSSFPRSYWIIGEIQNLQLRQQTLYFRLSEGQQGLAMGSASVSCILWPNITMKLQAKLGAPLQSWLVEGSEIRCQAQVSFYKDRAQISLQIIDIDDQFTLGKMALQRQKTLQSLRKRGLAQRNKNLKMPVLPLSIGLITAKDSRAQSDFLHQLQDQGFPGKVFVANASMQGKQTSEEVRHAYEVLMEQGVDVIVLTRGGGSQADLRWFDSEEIAEIICQAQVPFLVAIGHHDDVSIAEEVCHTHVKTPTAAAEAILTLVRDFQTHLQNSLKELFLALEEASRRKSFALQEQQILFQQSYQRTLLQHREKHRLRLLQLSSAGHQSQQAVRYRLEQWQQRLESLAEAALVKKRATLDRNTQNLSRSMDLCLQQLSYQIESKLQALRVKDPSPWLVAGWTQIQTATGKVLKSVTEAHLEEFVTAQLGDGQLSMQIKIKKGNPR